MNLHEMRRFALEYLYSNLVDPTEPIQNYEINGQLNYRLCGAFDHFQKQFGEVTRKDVVMLIESWIMAQSAVAPESPLRNRLHARNIAKTGP